MLSRRHLRIKVFQVLFAAHQNPDLGIRQAEKTLRKAIEDIYRLYLYELRMLAELQKQAVEIIEKRKIRKLPQPEDLQPNYKFVQNAFLSWLNNHPLLLVQWEEHHIQLGEDRERLRKIYLEIEGDERFRTYMQSSKQDLSEDKGMVKYLYARFLTHDEALHQSYEDRSIFWADDLDAAQMMVTKTLKSFAAQTPAEGGLTELIKDEEDLDFAMALFRKCWLEGKDFEERIRNKAENWETERIALVDIVLMKMGLAELVSFTQIPVKVTLNEYIELAKEYSTPKSGVFVNGILDKLKEEMLKSGEIRKIGRGLI